MRFGYSIVVPVYNEGENIHEFCRRAVTELPSGFELLVCYDFPEDTTLRAIDELPDASRPVGLRLVENRLGPGVRNAIVSGFEAAQAPIVIVMMADLSDDFSKVEEMLERAGSGATVVAASRYIRGGKQVGGPLLKSTLSRVAGVTLHLLSGLPTHDPTNSFKAYRREFLKSTEIESTVGFCLAMELTLKAHFSGLRVEEIPATWWDRNKGTSRFRLWAWMPHYMYWYFWGIGARVMHPPASRAAAR